MVCAISSHAQAVDFTRDIQPILRENCYNCHGSEKQKGGLRLDSRKLAMDGGTSGKSIVPGKGKDSPLVQRLRGLGGEDQMPLKKDPLPEAQIQLISAWIDQGAVWPDSADNASATIAKHWSFVKPDRPAEPTVKNQTWVRNPIDRFVLAKLEKENIKPSPEAPRETLLRRVFLDLIGLPPSPSEIDQFLSDKSPDAYEKLVDRLLASPHYGERWARHWLDQARYADSNGYSQDNPRSIWKYRDWVIDAFNRDMPFDQFTIEQLAGDLLPNATINDRIATGFHRNTMINEEGGIDPEQFRVEAVIDRVGTTGTVFLGLTIACAQCHNHKFDPISQKDFYQLFAFFNNQDEPKITVSKNSDPQAEEMMREQIGRLEAQIKDYTDQLGPRVAEWEKNLSDDARAKLKPAVLAALKVEPDQRDKKQWDLINNEYKAEDADYQRQANELKALKKQQMEGVTTLVLAERKEPRVTHILTKGDFTRPAEVVTPGVPAVLPPLKTPNPNRLDLARWLFEPENPLTARVAVNRIWMQYFGRGIVETDNDFGTQGTPPTNPDLLDWLATEFIRQNWSMKAMHKLIVTSATYRQSSANRAELANSDPYNRLLARQTRQRLDAEIVRDSCLMASGLFYDKIGGPSVFPPQPDGVMNLGQIKHVWRTSTGADRYRRGLYTFWYRATLHPLMTSFDAPDATSTCTRRLKSNTPLQALTLLNDDAFVEFARALAARVIKEGPADDAGKLDYAFKLCVTRAPSADERAVLEKVLKRELDALKRSPNEAKALAGNPPQGTDAARLAAWTVVSRVLLNVDEAITRE